MVINDPSKLFFISDTHFYHYNIIKYAGRPFADVNEMNDTLIKNWNEKIPEDGIVFHLGDFSFCTPHQLLHLTTILHGNIHLILGNHDWRIIRDKLTGGFASVSLEQTLNVCGQKIILNHFPMLCYGGSYHAKPIWQLFGHVHSGPNDPKMGLDTNRLQYLFPSQYDVGVDNNNYAPISYNELYDKINRQIETKTNMLGIYMGD